jgi:hypothetical protein
MKKIISISLIVAFIIIGASIFAIINMNETIEIPIIPFTEVAPTAKDPIAIQEELRIKQDARVHLEFSYYNSENNTQLNTRPTITNCSDETGKQIQSNDLPKIFGPKIDIEPLATTDFRVILTIEDSNFIGGKTYICTLSIVGDNNQILADKNILITVSE